MTVATVERLKEAKKRIAEMRSSNPPPSAPTTAHVPSGQPDKPTVTRKPPPQPRRTKGVGDHLKDVTAELGLTMKQGCNCASLAAEMNRRGPDGCRAKREKLVAELENNAKKYSWGDVARAAVNAVKTGLAWKINPLDPYGSLLDEAIRRAENTDKELNHADPN